MAAPMPEKGGSGSRAKYGNFNNYYQFNKPEERLKMLPKDLVTYCNLTDQSQVVALDIGCNSGELTTHLCRNLASSGLTDVKMLAIDIDSSLIECAKKNCSCPETIEYMCLDITSNDSIESLIAYLKKVGKDAFDITFCFSVTMWIHLNHGDSGLKQFLETVSKNTHFLLVEAQLWKCYRSASRRMRRGNETEFQNLDTLSMNVNVEDNIHDFLQGRCGLEVVECFGQTQWGRKVTLYQRKKAV
ncbi:pre-miRNA 5'-monophosphate methyltransferase-like [Dermacentor silvarum]|uniref:pre-miRNA 5'-monophosphate methyltransferase-like n=1 Tax=Dermacentor silvarum TaxID=543639 RepID=UPI0018979CE7|nr:pre-miRNA 5'-monophosphate methyltransferase-like [Dermacentor silvarum]